MLLFVVILEIGPTEMHSAGLNYIPLVVLLQLI